MEQFQRHLADFHAKFMTLVKRYDGTLHPSSELEATIDEYSAFITNGQYEQAWGELERQPSGKSIEIIEELRRSSALCVAIMEKYRALKLLGGRPDQCDYFQNIETCIEQEFGSFHVTSESKVILVGSGSFPMTPLFIAKRTGAAVVGVDIDEEAIELGRKVVENLGGGLDIRLERKPVEQLDMIQEATHIIFSSTIPEKYDLLDRLHAFTDKQVIVAMRYGNGLKSLFNYPQQETDERKWRLVESVLRPGHVFDIAVYQKA